ncbi:hypothetical protein ACIBXA_18155 [Micromonospora echinaurantiaca]|uniref:hypothetical protein n=1 Tax=Micromonospora echinaurantiaca TaxID=47857 RepID=UPI003789C8AD
MGEVLPMPGFGDLFADTRGDDRTMRVSYHPERGAVVLSLWSGTVCRGSFRLAVGDAPRLLSLLGQISAAAVPGAPPDDPTSMQGTRATAAVPAPAPDPVEQTGQIAGPAHRAALPIVPAPRVA